MSSANPTIAEATTRYTLARYERQEITRATAKSFRESLRLFADFVGRERPLASINRDDVDRWIRSMTRLAPATVRLRIGTVRTFFRWSLLEGLVKADPTVGFRLPRLPRYTPRGLQRDTLSAVLDEVIDERERLMVILMLTEGLRSIEIANLQMGDIDREERTMVVKGKGGHERILPITEEAWSALESYLSVRGRFAGRVIQTVRPSYANPGDGITPSTVRTIVKGVLRRAGVTSSAHSLRHTFATALFNNGANIRDVQGALGHVSIATTQVYIGITAVRDLRPLMEKHRVRS